MIHPYMKFKLALMPYELHLLNTIHGHLKDHRTLIRSPYLPSTWGWGSAKHLLTRMGKDWTKRAEVDRLKQGIETLEKEGLLMVHKVNEPGKKNGARRFLIPGFALLSDVFDSWRSAVQLAVKKFRVSLGVGIKEVSVKSQEEIERVGRFMEALARRNAVCLT